MSINELLKATVVERPGPTIGVVNALIVLLVGFDIPLSEKKIAVLSAFISTVLGFISTIFRPTPKPKQHSKQGNK